MDLLEVGKHRLALSMWPEGVANEAFKAVTSIDPDEFERYSNPFEQKWFLADKTAYPEVTRYIQKLEETIEEASMLFDARLIHDPTHHFTGVFKYGEGDSLSVHVDAGIHPRFQVRKRVTAIVYLGEAISSLEFWGGTSCASKNPEIGELLFPLPTLNGQVVLFENNDYAWHGVPRYLGKKPRVVITVSFLCWDVDEFENLRERAYFVPRPGEKWTNVMYNLRDIRADPKKYHEVYRV